MRRETSAAIGELFRGFSGYVQACGDDRGGTLARTFGARYVRIRELGLRTRRPAGDCDVKINRLTGAAFYLNGALGTGRYQDIDIATVKAAIRQGTIFDFLEERLGDDLDISLWDNDDRAEILAEWRDLTEVNESRKFCVVERVEPAGRLPSRGNSETRTRSGRIRWRPPTFRSNG